MHIAKLWGVQVVNVTILQETCPGGGSGGGGYSQTKRFGGGAWPFSQKRYPIYDQHLQYSLPYLR